MTQLVGKRRTMSRHFLKFCCAIALLIIAIPSYSQFNAGLYNFGPNLLMRSCVGDQPLSPLCVARIFWDANNNGPDALDQQPVVGNGFGQCNFNSFTLQSGYDYEVPGGFYLDPYFTISTITPQPSLYYIVVDCQETRWTSAVFTILNGLNDYDLGAMNWICEVHEVPCDAPTLINILIPENGQFPVPFTTCIQLCAGVPVQICNGPLGPRPNQNRPHGYVIPGCASWSGCDVECFPAQFGYDDATWVYNETDSTWCNWIYPGEYSGCVCFGEEFLPVEYASFEAQSRNSSLFVVWSTASEKDVDYFRLSRDGQVVHTAAATNHSTGSTYSFLDENLTNGRSYTYSLEVVNLDGTVESWPTVTSATPSIDAAIVTEYALHQNYPNPFNPNTSIVFDVLEENSVDLRVFNTIGQEVATLVDAKMSSGRHTVAFDASNLTSGLYFYTVKIGADFTATKKMLLTK